MDDEYKKRFIEQDEYRDIQALVQDGYPYYFTYLRFEDGELVAAITRDDFIAWYDYRHCEWVSNLADTVEMRFEEILPMEKYLNGYSEPLPDLLWDGSPNPMAGKIYTDEGMAYFYKTIVTNDVEAARRWADSRGLDEWKIEEYDAPEVSHEAIQEQMIRELKDYAFDSSGNAEYEYQEAKDTLQRLKDKGVSID